MVRFKNRYLVAQVAWKDPGAAAGARLQESAVLEAVRQGLQENFGEAGLAQAVQALQVKFLEPRTGLLLLRCNRADARRVWCCLTLVTALGRENAVCMVRVLHVSGALPRAQAELAARLEPALRALGRDGADRDRLVADQLRRVEALAW